MKKNRIIIFTFAVILIVFISDISKTQTLENLNGSRFRGLAEEQTPPNVDRMPIVMDEVILFDNGLVSGEVMKKYSMNECSYTAEIDERRMIAVKVVNFKSECRTVYNGEEVTVKYTGSIYGDLWMSGDIVIVMKDNSEIKFNFTAEAE